MPRYTTFEIGHYSRLSMVCSAVFSMEGMLTDKDGVDATNKIREVLYKTVALRKDNGERTLFFPSRLEPEWESGNILIKDVQFMDKCRFKNMSEMVEAIYASNKCFPTVDADKYEDDHLIAIISETKYKMALANNTATHFDMGSLNVNPQGDLQYTIMKFSDRYLSTTPNQKPHLEYTDSKDMSKKVARCYRPTDISYKETYDCIVNIETMHLNNVLDSNEMVYYVLMEVVGFVDNEDHVEPGDSEY